MQPVFERAWLFISKTSSNVYDDNISNYYSYDDNVPNWQRVKVGDLVIIREDDYLAGWSIVDALDVMLNQPKAMLRCPRCGSSSPDFRKRTADYRCVNKSCQSIIPDSEIIRIFESVTQFRANYSLNWNEGVRRISSKAIEPALISAKGINSIRPLKPDAVGPILEELSGRSVDLRADFPPDTIQFLVGGHSEAIVRRRRGQRAFRFAMLDRFGERCAFTGVQPPQVLEAAHLYSYAEVGQHHSDAGLLLRRDCHTLFDAKLVTVDPKSYKIEISPYLEQYETYRGLNGKPLQVAQGFEPSPEYLEVHHQEAMAVFNSY